ncbi:MAG: Na+/H+ antiporter, partial [Burkholderiales bacterium]|nr:Na+/H+ antiporter [Burkholderiales bacterium]
LVLLRLIWVWISLRRALFKARRSGTPVHRPHWRLLLATSLAGVRGAITLAGVMTLPLAMPDGTPLPARDLAVFLATAVILLSLVLASAGLPRLLRGLVLPPEPSAAREEDLARHEAAAAAIAAVERVQRSALRDVADADLHTQAAARVVALYQHRLAGAGAGESAGQLRKADQIEGALRVAALQAEREAVFGLARRNLISDETSRRLVREIDLLESRYR